MIVEMTLHPNVGVILSCLLTQMICGWSAKLCFIMLLTNMHLYGRNVFVHRSARGWHCISRDARMKEISWKGKQQSRGNSRKTWQTIKVLLRRNFHIFFPAVFLNNVKYRCKLREITMNRVRLNFFCRDITLQKSQKLLRHCFVRKPRVRCILKKGFVLWSHPINHARMSYRNTQSHCGFTLFIVG